MTKKKIVIFCLISFAIIATVVLIFILTADKREKERKFANFIPPAYVTGKITKMNDRHITMEVINSSENFETGDIIDGEMSEQDIEQIKPTVLQKGTEVRIGYKRFIEKDVSNTVDIYSVELISTEQS